MAVCENYFNVLDPGGGGGALDYVAVHTRDQENA